jgi:hypothetical protein
MTIIKYGDKVHILNGYHGDGHNDWTGGYLDTNGNSTDGDAYNVSTNKSKNRDASGTGTWILVSESKPAGDPVVSGDVMHLKNMYGAGNGAGPGCYLDSINFFPNGKYKVEASLSAHRDGGSGTWQLQAQSSNPADGKVRYHDVVQLINQYGANGGFLDTYGWSSAGSGALLATCTSYYSDRAPGQLTASWKIEPARS